MSRMRRHCSLLIFALSMAIPAFAGGSGGSGAGTTIYGNPDYPFDSNSPSNNASSNMPTSTYNSYSNKPSYSRYQTGYTTVSKGGYSSISSSGYNPMSRSSYNAQPASHPNPKLYGYSIYKTSKYSY